MKMHFEVIGQKSKMFFSPLCTWLECDWSIVVGMTVVNVDNDDDDVLQLVGVFGDVVSILMAAVPIEWLDE